MCQRHRPGAGVSTRTFNNYFTSKEQAIAWLAGQHASGMAVALTALFTLAVWNDQAWVVRKDVARFAGTTRLDVRYLARLSADAYPALLDALPHLPNDQRQVLASELWPRAMCAVRDDAHWFEWNASRARARAKAASNRSSL